nr:signal peptidase I [Celeribacter sp. PS-C1]
MRFLTVLFFTSLFTSPASAACICLKCAFGEHHMFQTSSSAMLPTFAPGDCPIARLYNDTLKPQRGQSIAFAENGLVFLFRIIGLAGDQIQLIEGEVFLNGTALKRERGQSFRLTGKDDMRIAQDACDGQTECDVSLTRETLPDGTSYEVLDVSDTRLDTAALFTVPKGHVFVLGDNRDNAADSRLPSPMGRGFIALNSLIGVFEEE